MNQDHLPPDASSVNLTLQYLTACNSIFEQGFLSHKKVSINEQEVLKNIQQGFAFYSGWLKSILDEGIVHIIVLQIHVTMCTHSNHQQLEMMFQTLLINGSPASIMYHIIIEERKGKKMKKHERKKRLEKC